jgi:hypothetical protein
MSNFRGKSKKLNNRYNKPNRNPNDKGVGSNLKKFGFLATLTSNGVRVQGPSGPETRTQLKNVDKFVETLLEEQVALQCDGGLPFDHVWFADLRSELTPTQGFVTLTEVEGNFTVRCDSDYDRRIVEPLRLLQYELEINTLYDDKPTCGGFCKTIYEYCRELRINYHEIGPLVPPYLKSKIGFANFDVAKRYAETSFNSTATYHWSSRVPTNHNDMTISNFADDLVRLRSYEEFYSNVFKAEFIKNKRLRTICGQSRAIVTKHLNALCGNRPKFGVTYHGKVNRKGWAARLYLVKTTLGPVLFNPEWQLATLLTQAGRFTPAALDKHLEYYLDFILMRSLLQGSPFFGIKAHATNWTKDA